MEEFSRPLVNIQYNTKAKLVSLAKLVSVHNVICPQMMMLIYDNYGYPPSTGTAPIDTNILFVSLGVYVP
jgi:hypothetical protein